MLRRTLFVALLMFNSILLGCGRQSDGPGVRRVAQVAQPPENLERPVPAVAGEQSPPRLPRKIVYTCQIDLVVEEMNAAVRKLTTLIESIEDEGGYLAKQEFGSASHPDRRSLWTIRVPLSQLRRFVSEAEQLGESTRNSRDAQDMTEAYADLEARLRNKQWSEKRLLGHLEKSLQLKDTLELEREVTRVRGEIEQLQGQLNLLTTKTELATVTITISERPEVAPATTPTFSTMVWTTFSTSWNCLVVCGEFLTLIVVAVAPWCVTLGLLLSPFWFIRRHEGADSQPMA